LEEPDSNYYNVKKNVDKTVYLESKVDTEYNFWALSLDTEIFCGLNTDTPLINHITEKINAFILLSV
jgi:hypothetical protein